MLLFTLNLGSTIPLLNFGGLRASLVALNVAGELDGLDAADSTGPL